MKLNRVSLAIFAAIAMPVAHAGVTVTPLILGYHVSESIKDTAKKQREVFKENTAGTGTGSSTGYALKDGLYTGAGIGIELTPTIALELEYGEKNVDARTDKKADKNTFVDGKQQLISGNFAIGTETFTGYTNSALKPYILVGAGQSKITVKHRNASGTKKAGEVLKQEKDTIGNLGLGANYRINDALSLRGEARAIYNFDQKWWEGMALAGLNVVLGGHLAPKAADVDPIPQEEVVEQTYVPEEPEIIETPTVDGDDDQDGVLNSMDACPNTPINVVVDARGCPRQINVSDNLNMELRVFFDRDKSNIKDQYRSEVAKVAEKMVEYPNATATIEGYASKDSKRSSAKYNQRLSEARANAVKGMLVNQFGIAPTRLATIGYGFDRPIASNDTAEGRAANRRVYAIITGNKVKSVTQTKDMVE